MIESCPCLWLLVKSLLFRVYGYCFLIVEEGCNCSFGVYGSYLCLLVSLGVFSRFSFFLKPLGVLRVSHVVTVTDALSYE